MGSPAALRKHLEKGNHTKVNMKVLETTKGGRTSKERLDEAKKFYKNQEHNRLKSEGYTEEGLRAEVDEDRLADQRDNFPLSKKGNPCWVQAKKLFEKFDASEGSSWPCPPCEAAGKMNCLQINGCRSWGFFKDARSVLGPEE